MHDKSYLPQQWRYVEDAFPSYGHLFTFSGCRTVHLKFSICVLELNPEPHSQSIKIIDDLKPRLF